MSTTRFHDLIKKYKWLCGLWSEGSTGLNYLTVKVKKKKIRFEIEKQLYYTYTCSLGRWEIYLMPVCSLILFGAPLSIFFAKGYLNKTQTLHHAMFAASRAHLNSFFLRWRGFVIVGRATGALCVHSS